MPLSSYARVGDFTDDEANGKGGRSSQDSAQLDAEFDAIKAVLDEATTLFDVLLRSDNKLADGLIESNAVSSTFINYLAGVVNADATWVHMGAWAAATEYSLHNIVSYSGDSYICTAAHTSPGAWDGVNWESLATSALPSQSGHANKALITDGTNDSWSLIGPSNTTGLAPSASPTFTGVVDIDGSIKTNKSEAGTGLTRDIDFDGSPNQTVTLSGNTTFTSSNYAAASGEVKIVDVLLIGDGSTRTLTFPAWTWLTSTPASITASKKGLLSLRSYGTTASDVVAAFVEEP